MNKSARILWCITLLLCCSRVVAQNREWGKIWVQGENVVYTTTFSGSLTPLNDTLKNSTSLYFATGASNICDSAGNLAIICDGYNIYDKQLNLIDGGDTVIPKLLYNLDDGFTVYAQSSIILPFTNNKYHIITPAASDSDVTNHWVNPNSPRAIFDLLLCDEVDMNANAGAGRVTKRMTALLKDVKLSKTQMMACRHGDGKSWWLLKQASDTNMVYKFLLTDSMIYGPYIQGFSEPHFTDGDICGQSMFSRDGTRYATTVQNARKIFVADFDRCSGRLSNPKVIDVPPRWTGNLLDSTEQDSSSCGLCFSPNGRFLYVNSFFTVQQCDLQDSNPVTRWTSLSGADTTLQEFQQYSNIYPGEDGKLYVGNQNGLGGQMSVIDDPDNKGTACNFCPKCLRFPGFYFQGVVRHFTVTSPPCIPNYCLGALSPICYLGVEPVLENQFSFSLYPNPASGIIRIESSEAGTLQLYDAIGRMVSSLKINSAAVKTELHLPALPAGIYHYRFVSSTGQISSGKLHLI